MSPTTTAEAPKSPGKTKLSAEEHRQLLTHHMSKLRAKRSEIEELRAPLKDAQEDFTALVNEAKADLGKGYTRKYLQTLLEDTTTRLRNLLEEEQRRAQDREALGLPVFGLQADLFDGASTAKMPAEARDELFYEAEGYLLGRRGALRAIPDGVPPRFHQAVLRGFDKGQLETQDDFLRAQELIAKRAQPDAAAEAVDLNPEPSPEAQIEDGVRKLKRSGFTERAPANEHAAA